MNKIICITSLAFVGLLTADSLWKDDISRGPVADKKARFIGDILNIRVQESNSAKRAGKTSTSRSSTADASISNLFFTTSSATNGSQAFHHGGAFPAMKFENATKHDAFLFESNAKCNFGNFDFRLDSIENACQYSAFFYAVDLDYTDDIS